MTVRVLRLLEYTYGSQEKAEQDMSHWGIPASGSRSVGVRSGDEYYPTGPREMIIRSAVIPQETIFQEPVWRVEDGDPRAAVPHTFVPSHFGKCDFYECAKDNTDPIHRTDWFESGIDPSAEVGPFVGQTDEVVVPRDPRVNLARHAFMEPETTWGRPFVEGGYTPCAFPGCGLPERNIVHEPTPGWPPQDSGY